jgi:hypothetical protein
MMNYEGWKIRYNETPPFVHWHAFHCSFCSPLPILAFYHDTFKYWSIVTLTRMIMIQLFLFLYFRKMVRHQVTLR